MTGGPLKRGPRVEILSGRVCLLDCAGGLLALVLPERALRLDHVRAGTLEMQRRGLDPAIIRQVLASP